MGGCQNYGPFLGPYYSTAPNIEGTQKGAIILTSTHIGLGGYLHMSRYIYVYIMVLTGRFEATSH